MKRLGIIGGHGPEVSAFFYWRLINKLRRKYGIWKDEDYPHILLYNLPLPEFTTPLKLMKNKLEIEKRLKEAISLFKAANVDIICYPCNTLSYFLEFIRKNSTAKVIDIVEETLKVTTSFKDQEFVVLGTESTRNYKLYGNTRYINAHDIIEQILKGNNVLNDFMYLLQSLRKKFKSHSIVLGCTELSLIYLQHKSKICSNIDCRKIIDSLETLLDKIVIALLENET